MPVLRFQLARVQVGQNRRRAAVRRLCRCAARRSRPGPAAGVGPHGAHRVLRRRHAEPVPAGIHRPLPAGRQFAAALRAGRRDHPGDQPGHRRTRPLRRLPRRRREPAQLRHPELRRRLPAAPGPHSRQRGGRGGGETGAGRRLRQFQPRPDVRIAAADPGDGRVRPRARVRAAAHPRLALSAHPGTQHRVRGPAAGRHPRRGQQLGHPGALPGATGRRRLCAVRSQRVRPARPRVRAQPQLLALRRLPRHRRRRPRQAHARQRAEHPAALEAQAPDHLPRPRRHPGGHRRRRAHRTVAAAVRIHAQRAAAGGRFQPGPVRGAHRSAGRVDRAATGRGGRPGLAGREPWPCPADRARPALHQ